MSSKVKASMPEAKYSQVVDDSDDISGLAEAVPEHIAIIMDGNHRWAKKRFFTRRCWASRWGKATSPYCRSMCLLKAYLA